jgi:DNA-binding transcriptional ArsR family regulator
MTNAPAMMTALGDPTRQAIFDRLSDGPRPVGEIASGLPVSRPAVSQHLKVLKDADLVIDRAVGAQRVYEINPAGLAAVRDYFEQFWRNSLAAFAAAAGTKEDT